MRRCHDRLLHHLFRSGWIIAQVIAAAFGVIAITSVIARSGVQLHAEPGQIPATIVLGLVAVSIHELGHALVTVHYGRHVRTVGIRLHLGSPAFYVESVDALLLSRRQRIIQAAAGPWAEWLATSVALAVLVVLPSDSDAASLLQRFVIINTIGIAINLLPFVGLDGALLLSEIVHEPDLVWRSREVLTSRSRRGGIDRWLIGYAFANAAVGAALLVSAVFFWWQLFGGLVARLLTSGPLGVIVVVAAVVASSRPLRSIVRTFLACALAAVTPLQSKSRSGWSVAGASKRSTLFGHSPSWMDSTRTCWESSPDTYSEFGRATSRSTIRATCSSPRAAEGSRGPTPPKPLPSSSSTRPFRHSSLVAVT